MNTKKLCQAIKSGDAGQVKEMLRDEGKRDVRLTKGFTPLHFAAKRGNIAVVTAILEAGADLNPTSDMLQTPLDVAAQYNHNDIAKLLIRKGGRRGADLTLHGAAAAGDLKVAHKHVAGGADVDQLLDDKLPLCIALERRHWAVAKYLLKKSANAAKPQKCGTTPLHLAASTGAPEDILAKLLKAGAVVDAKDACLCTPLGHAAEAGDESIVNWLLDHGADVSYGHVGSSTPVYLALSKGHDELASYLIDRGAKASLHQAIQCNHLVCARQKLNSGADVNHEKDPIQLGTPLETAVWLDNAEMVALLLEFGADPNQQDPPYQSNHVMRGGDTALHNAVYAGSAKMVKLLLAHGADPDMPNAAGLSPIELANRRDHTHLARLMEAHLDKELSLSAAQAGIEQLYTVPIVAELLSVDDNYVMELIKARKITGLQLDEKTLRITAGSIQRYLAKIAARQRTQ